MVTNDRRPSRPTPARPKLPPLTSSPLPPVVTRTNSVLAAQRAERRYLSSMRRIFQIMRQCIKDLKEPTEIVNTLKTVAQRPEFTEHCTKAAEQMVTTVAVAEKATWREAAAESTRGAEIYKTLQKNTAPDTAVGIEMRSIVERNSQMIKTVPENMARELSELAQKRKFEGVRAEDITLEILEKAPHLSEIEARRIARTEASKAATALVRARAMSSGREWYVWRTSRDGDRVREAHQHMEGVLCRWSDPPDPEAMFGGGKSVGPYDPGCIYNCRCKALPVIDLRFEKFPCKVHVAGQIITIRNAKEFSERFAPPKFSDTIQWTNPK